MHATSDVSAPLVRPATSTSLTQPEKAPIMIQTTSLLFDERNFAANPDRTFPTIDQLFQKVLPILRRCLDDTCGVDCHHSPIRHCAIVEISSARFDCTLSWVGGAHRDIRVGWSSMIERAVQDASGLHPGEQRQVVGQPARAFLAFCRKQEARAVAEGDVERARKLARIRDDGPALGVPGFMEFSYPEHFYGTGTGVDMRAQMPNSQEIDFHGIGPYSLLVRAELHQQRPDGVKPPQRRPKPRPAKGGRSPG